MQQRGERGVRMWYEQPCRCHDWWRKRGRRCPRCWSRNSPAACEDWGDAGCFPVAYRRQRWSRYPPAAVEGPHWSRLIYPGGPHKRKVSHWNCGPLGTLTGAVHSWRTLLPERTHSRAVVGEWHPVGRACVGEVHEELHSMGESPCQSRGRAPGRRSGRDDVWWIDHNLHSSSPLGATWWGAGRRAGSEVELKDGVGDFFFRFISQCPTFTINLQ